jgi:hypothetical protein
LPEVTRVRHLDWGRVTKWISILSFARDLKTYSLFQEVFLRGLFIFGVFGCSVFLTRPLIAQEENSQVHVTQIRSQEQKGDLTITSGQARSSLEMDAVMEAAVQQGMPIVVVTAKKEVTSRWLKARERIKHAKTKAREALFLDHPNEISGDGLGMVWAAIRTTYSTVLWIYVADLSLIQSLAMFSLQLSLNSAFTYKGYFLNILKLSESIGLWAGKKMGRDFTESPAFISAIRYTTHFNVGAAITVASIGILEWEDFFRTFSQSDVYFEIAFYSLMGVLATGSWGDFLTEQKFSRNPVLGKLEIQRIQQLNGLILAVAFPLLVQGHQIESLWMSGAGLGIMASIGFGGMVMSKHGERIIPALRARLQRKAKNECRAVFI